MKRAIILTLILMLFISVGCSKDANKPSKEDVNNKGQNLVGQENNDDDIASFSFTSNGIKILMNSEASEILLALGDPIDHFEAPSCAFKGIDRFYLYPGYELSTYPLDGKDYISSVVFMDDTVSTEEGISIGATKEEVIKAYGNEYEESGNLYIYRAGNSKLAFVINDDYVENITYTAIAGEQQ